MRRELRSAATGDERSADISVIVQTVAVAAARPGLAERRGSDPL
jgi:hypothetical protein